MPFKFSTAPALFLGLGARILLDQFSRLKSPQPPPPPSIPDFLVFGAWQGVALYYALIELPSAAIIIAMAIGAKLLIEFMLLPDVIKCAVTLLGVAIGVMFTDVLSQFLEDGGYIAFGGKKRSANGVSSSYKRQRTVSFSRKDTKDASRRDRDRDRDRKISHSDITAPSLDSTLDWIDRTARTPLDREVATLRARASLADTEKRRYKEERIWALASGNQARADQMSWQIKRYRALTHGFHKEADRKLLEANANGQATSQPIPRTPAPVASSSRLRQNSGGSARPIPVPPPRADPSAAEPLDSRGGGTSSRRHRRVSSGNLKSTLRGNKYG